MARKTWLWAWQCCCWLRYGKSNLINVLVRTDVSSNRPNLRKRRSSIRVRRTRVHPATMARSNRRIRQPARRTQVTSRASTRARLRRASTRASSSRSRTRCLGIIMREAVPLIHIRYILHYMKNTLEFSIFFCNSHAFYLLFCLATTRTTRQYYVRAPSRGSIRAEGSSAGWPSSPRSAAVLKAEPIFPGAFWLWPHHYEPQSGELWWRIALQWRRHYQGNIFQQLLFALILILEDKYRFKRISKRRSQCHTI